MIVLTSHFKPSDEFCRADYVTPERRNGNLQVINGFSRFDILPAPSPEGLPLARQGRGFLCETAMPGRENVLGSINVTVMCRSTIATRPFSYSKT